MLTKYRLGVADFKRKLKGCQYLQPMLGRQALPRNRFHHVAEPIQLAQGRIYVGRDADALEFVMDDRRCEDSMFVE